ncbi:MFS transporter [Weizmannia acidilactici]|uniref:MFS transporter n=1 Tax=Weizmannia acidilactici TaxID=2607726 RepID=A0A5J4J6L8_9BACI|nr:MFS transporter [Weizmannia acidilactici]GER68229.1 MFS transporter [Weizmannia acidilactici]GER70576.1 MFS transporter [Weizmannia acidilactici]GER73137.1 MFS transporter [Weizmannia acidilactici]
MTQEKRNLYIMLVCNFLVGASMTMIIPFLSLYIKTFGHFSDVYVQRWAGYIFGVTFLVAFIMSPVWGRIGDKYGFKPTLVITGFGIAASIFCMGLANNVISLFITRFFMGIVTGFIPTSMALISAQTPKEEAGKVLGTLQMGNVSGSLFGPMIGGSIADSFGFKYTFIITAATISIAALGVVFGIKEKRREPVQKKAAHVSSIDVLKRIVSHRILITVMVIALLIQMANFSVQPLLALYVSHLTSAGNVALLSGMAFSATGFGNLLLTRQWGALGDKFGHAKVLLVLLVLACAFMVPQALVNNLWELIILRFLFGMVVGGMNPSIVAFIRLEAPLSMQGEVLGYNQSFRFLGNVTGPLLGGYVSGISGISSVFYVTGILFIFAFVLLFFSVKSEQRRQLQEGLNQ